MRILRGIVQICTAFGLLLLVSSYLGAAHPVGDSLAVFRHWIAAGVGAGGLLLAVLMIWRWAGVALLSAAVAAIPILWAQNANWPEPPHVTVTTYSKNLAHVRSDVPAVLADIEASGADILLLQELSGEDNDLINALATTYPHQHICRFSTWSGMAVISRWPLSGLYCSPHRSVAAAQVAHPEAPIWAVSIHLVWPYPEDQQAILAEALPFLESIEGRAVVAGDFNMVPWAHSARQIAAATGTVRIGRVHTTLRPADVPLSIDHVYTNGIGTTERRPNLGSDHFGLVARIDWP